MSRWATGVTIVTSKAGARIHGMTVSDFSGVSLSPPLVMVCADRNSNTHGVIADGKCFAVNVLAAGQETLSNRFASKKDEDRRFEGLELATAVTGAPLIPGAVASWDCTLVATQAAGDHDIYVGQVEELVTRDLEPLVYHAGVYRKLAPAETS
jgi:flavin reductase (DIM6/NTAB) family NADH-FMN oxidoreductase RutF